MKQRTGTPPEIESRAGEGPSNSNRAGRGPGSNLTAEETDRAERVARRLHAALGALVAKLPEHARGASGMARQLSVIRSTCQRVAAGLAESASEPRLLVQLPGVLGLTQLLAGFRRDGADEADLAAAEAAVEQFGEVIRDLAGSQARLARRLRSPGAAPPRHRAASPAQSAEAARRLLFNAAVEITGRSSEVQLSVYAFRLDPDDPARLERALVSGEIGIVTRPNAMPGAVVLGSVKQERPDPEHPSFETLDRAPAHGATPHALLTEFCTKPLPLITSRSAAGKLVQAIDHAAVPDGQPVDLVLANRSVHPACQPESNRSSMEGVWKLINSPSRHLIFDVYLHADMERHFRPGIDSQLWGPNLDVQPADRWLTRVPHGPRLVLLGPGLEHAAADAHPRHAETTRRFFEQLDWPADEFVGFRCEVAYPVWRGGYFMTFEEVSGAGDE